MVVRDVALVRAWQMLGAGVVSKRTLRLSLSQQAVCANRTPDHRPALFTDSSICISCSCFCSSSADVFASRRPTAMLLDVCLTSHCVHDEYVATDITGICLLVMPWHACCIVPDDLQQYVALYKTPSDPVFYEVNCHGYGIIPALANPAYYKSKLTSAAITSLMTGENINITCSSLACAV